MRQLLRSHVTLVVLWVVLFLVRPLLGQTFTILHIFTGGRDGGMPLAGVVKDRTGNLYGTTYDGGSLGYGTAFSMHQRNSQWVIAPLYSFQANNGNNDGANPKAKLAISRSGILYGTTQEGGGSCYCGTIFSLRPSLTPPTSIFTAWNEAVLYRFTGNSDGAFPSGDLVLDQTGNLYGTTIDGGLEGGTIFELQPSGGTWTFKVLYAFEIGNNDGSNPDGGVIVDQAGNLYGTTDNGGIYDDGTIFKLTPLENGWSESILYSFQNGSDGGHPMVGLAMDGVGNLFGATGAGGPDNGGTVFELSPSGDGWTYAVLHNFGTEGSTGGALVMGSSGNLYGTTYLGGAYREGSIFELSNQSGMWNYVDLHDFTGADGEEPSGSLIVDNSGNLFGTTSRGGAYSQGVVFELTP